MEKELEPYSEVFSASWKFFKNHYPPKDSERYFDHMLVDAKQAAGDNRFLLEMLAVCQRELRRDLFRNCTPKYVRSDNGEQS